MPTQNKNPLEFPSPTLELRLTCNKMSTFTGYPSQSIKGDTNE
jgi:hypothetical protein